MSLAWIILGAIFQFFLFGFLFMLTAFAGGAAANEKELSDFQITILNLSIYVLPCLSLLSIGITIFQYNHGGTCSSYWWHGMPIAAAILYIMYLRHL